MANCPTCGSIYVSLIDTNYYEDGWTMEVERIYECENCGQPYIGKSYYESEGYEDVEALPSKCGLAAQPPQRNWPN